MALKRTTNRFGALLDRFFIAKQLSLHQAGKILSQHHTVLSSVVRGIDTLSRKNLQTLIARLIKNAPTLDLSQEEAVDLSIDLQAAWLEDAALPPLAEEIAVVRRRHRAQPKVTDPRVEALARLDRASSASPKLAEWLIATVALMEKLPSHGRVYRRQEAAHPSHPSTGQTNPPRVGHRAGRTNGHAGRHRREDAG